MGVRVVDPLKDPRWDAFVSRHPRATAYHLAAWSGALRDAYRFAPVGLVLEDCDGRLRGVLPLGAKSGPVSGRRIVSLPVADMGGPIADSPVLESVLAAAACRLADASGAALRIHSRSARWAPGLPAADTEPAAPAWVVPLPDDADQAPRDWHRPGNLCRYLRKAQRAGLTVRQTSAPEDVRAFHAVYLRTARKHRAVPHSLRLFERLRRAFSSNGVFQLVLVEHEGTVVSGALNLAWGDTVEALFNGIDDRYLDLRPGHALHWEVIRMAVRAGRRRVNLGTARCGSSQASFKAQWGAEPVDEFALAYPSQRAACRSRVTRIWDERLAAAAWARAPDALMWTAGGLAHRWL